jgi:hypothetical protein
MEGPSIPAFSAARRTIVFLYTLYSTPASRNCERKSVTTSSEDAVAAAKVISGFAKDHEALEIKSGVMEGNVITAEEYSIFT